MTALWPLPSGCCGPVRLAVGPPDGAASRCGLPGGAGDVRGDDVGSVLVQASAGPVVPHCGSRVSVGGGLLHIAQRNPSIKRGGNKSVPKRVGADVFADVGAAGDLADDPPGAVPVQPPPVIGEEDGAIAAFPGGQVDRPGGARRQRDGDDLAALTGDRQVRCPRSRPRCSMSAPVASETRSPFSASREISACSSGGPSPAPTSRAPSSLRSKAVA